MDPQEPIVPPPTPMPAPPPAPPAGGYYAQPGYAAPYPPPGHYPGDTPGPQDPNRNGFSVAALVLGIIPITGGLLGIVFGLIGRSQAKRRNQKGRTMGTVGALLGAGWLSALIVVAVLRVQHDAKRDDAGHITKPGEASAFSLRVGDCVRNLPDGNDAILSAVNLVACTTPHEAEVYADTDLTNAEYPGDATVVDEAEAFCRTEFDTFVGKSYDDSTLELFYLRPTALTWRSRHDREVTCLVVGQNLVGSAKGAHR